MDITIKSSIVGNWCRIVQNTNDCNYKLTSLMYKVMYDLHTATVYKSTWLNHREGILIYCEMTAIRLSQSEGCSRKWLKQVMQLRLHHNI